MSKTLTVIYIVVSILFIGPHAKSAHRDERVGVGGTSNLVPMSTLSRGEMYQRAMAVLEYYGVPKEDESGPYLADLASSQSLTRIQKVLPFLDPHNVLSRFSELSPQELTTFLDLDSKQLIDVRVPLKKSDSAPTLRPKNLFLNSALAGDPNQPLKGLRIALDPGHMGGKFWDDLTSKFVRDRNGRTVSEGVIALQVCILLRQQLQDLGAEVMLTHEGFAPVTNLDYATFDLKPFALSELRDSVNLPWFQNLLNVSPPGPSLYQAFDRSTSLKKLFSNSSRDDYFIKRADLWARADLINNFNADLVLIVHFDTDEPAGNSTGLNSKAPKQTKAFVVGGYQPGELSSREGRKYFTRHLLDGDSWDHSLLLSRSIVQQFQKKMGQSLPTSADEETYVIEPGIFARNLVIPRRLKAPVISYLECLFYNRPDEFEALLKTPHSMIIQGQNVPYSERVVQVTNSIRDGILDYVQQIAPK